MAAIVWTDVVSLCGAAFADVPLDAQTLVLAHVNTTVNVAKFGGEESAKAKMARVYLAAHFAFGALPGQGGDAVAGPVIAESTGGVSRSYALVQHAISGSAIYATTTYGQKYEQLVRTSLARLPMVP